MKRIFIDGSSGTTGLRIHERLAQRQDIVLVTIPEELRKDPQAKREMLNDGCDIAFLCLPDDAAREAVALVESPDVVVLDTSTAHRTAPRFVYGFPELSPARWQAVQTAKRIAVPGCHASGFIALVYPLVEAGLIDPDIRLVCHSLTGYSGGGKKMIAQYEADGRDKLLDAPRQYGLSQTHKHLKEMVHVTGLSQAPVFCPIVADFYSGMEATVALFGADLKGTMADVKAVYAAKYNTPIVRYTDDAQEDGFLSAAALSGLDRMEIAVSGNEDRLLLTARYDNLGKGASGAAVECLNLVLGVDPTTGLAL
jgi:N-acetyl-gamma-glutamyl-phosphate reductase